MLNRFDVFEKLELKVAEIKEVAPVEGSDKLLQFQLDDGSETGRQILSGIAKWYPEPAKLIGEKVVIVANLKPKKMLGHESNGMILSAEHDGQVQLVTVPKNLVNGSGVE